MNQIILIHGLPDEEEVKDGLSPSPSNSHWFPWIQNQLTQKDILCQSLEMPRSYNPIYKEHEAVLGQMNITSETILVGHSSGGGFLLRYFSEHTELLPKKLILVAPWIDTEKYLQELSPDTTYFDFKIDQNLTQRTSVECIYSTDDEETLDSFRYIENSLPNMITTIFQDKGHFIESDLGGKEFPELLEIILK